MKATDLLVSIITFLILVLAIGLSGLRIFKEYERGVVFRLGRLVSFRGPGLSFVIPFIEKKVAAVVYFRVVNPNSTITQIENSLFGTSQLAQTTLRTVCGQAELDEILSQREKINAQIQEIVDTQTDPWGIKVALVAVKDINLPRGMRRAMAKQAAAERERRAKVVHAEGEFQAAQRLSDAAEIMAKQPAALHLRFLHALSQVAIEKNDTIILPVPIDLLGSLLERTAEAQ